MDNNFDNQMMQNPASAPVPPTMPVPPSAPVPPTSPNYSVPQNNNVLGQASGYMGQQANGYYAGTENYVYQQNAPYAAPVRKKHKALPFIIVGVSLVVLVGTFFALKLSGVIGADTFGSLFGDYQDEVDTDIDISDITGNETQSTSEGSGLSFSELFDMWSSKDSEDPAPNPDLVVPIHGDNPDQTDGSTTTPVDGDDTDSLHVPSQDVSEPSYTGQLIDPTDEMLTLANFASAGIAHNSIKRTHYTYDTYSDEIGWGVHNALYFYADEDDGAYFDQYFNCYMPLEQAHDIIRAVYGFDMNDLSDIMYSSIEGDQIKIDYSTTSSYDYSFSSPYRAIKRGSYVYVSGSVFDGEGNFDGDLTVKMVEKDDCYGGYTLVESEFVKQESVGMTATASSTLKPQQGNSYDASNIVDGSMDTAWVEGASGLGIGESVTISLDSKTEIMGFGIYAGYMKDLNSFMNNGYPVEVTVDFDGGYYYTVTLEPEYDDRYHHGTWFTLDKVNYTDIVTITINDAVAGSKYDDVCISEFTLFTVPQISEIAWSEAFDAYKTLASSSIPVYPDEGAGFDPDIVLNQGTPMKDFKYAGTYMCNISDVIDDLAPKIILDTDGYCALYTYEDNQSYQMKYDGWYTYDIVEPEFTEWGDTSYIHMHFPTPDGEMTADAVIELGMLIFETEGYGRMINGEGNGSLGGIFEYCY